MYALTNCTIFTGNNVLENYSVVIAEDKINTVCPDTERPDNIAIIDLNGANLSPGFIDLQLNGCGGVMFNDDISADTLNVMHRTNLKSGCTSFLPTLITSSNEDMKLAIKAEQEYRDRYQANSLGLHLEGPYLNLAKKGIHNPKYIRHSDDAMIDFICENNAWITKVTLAPEQNSPEHIQRLNEAGIVVSIGHSNATYTEASKGFEAGIRFATHLFNAMSPMTSREPGVIGAVYDNSDVYAGIIVDGHHVAYPNVRISHQIKQDKLVLVTDATAPAGADIDHFIFVGNKVYYRNGICVDENGTLGGSALTMIEAVQNTVEHAGIALDEAIRMATLYPAKAIAVDAQLGSIEQGKLADLAIFDHNFNVLATVVNGQFEKT